MLRSSDQPAEEGVLPVEEQRKLGIETIRLPATTPNEMDDSADAHLRRQIRDHILTFLND